MGGNELQERLFKFAVDVLRLLKSLKGGTDLNIISYQLGKSSTSSGANYEEAQAAKHMLLCLSGLRHLSNFVMNQNSNPFTRNLPSGTCTTKEFLDSHQKPR